MRRKYTVCHTLALADIFDRTDFYNLDEAKDYARKIRTKKEELDKLWAWRTYIVNSKWERVFDADKED